MNPHIKGSYIYSILQYKSDPHNTSDGGDSRRMEQGALKQLTASEQNSAACWALMVELAFLGGRKRPPFAAASL